MSLVGKLFNASQLIDLWFHATCTDPLRPTVANPISTSPYTALPTASSVGTPLNAFVAQRRM